MTPPADTPTLASPEYRELLDGCIRCGLCLPACPTYDVLRTEMDSPRGRIALMRAAADGRIGVEGAFREHVDLCLGCRACEPACPSGVRYGALLEGAREAIEAQGTHTLGERFLRWLALRQLLPHRRRLRAVARLVRLARALGLVRLARSGAAPAGLRRAAALLGGARFGKAPARTVPAVGERRGTVALFRGCVQDAFLPAVNASTARVLARNGYEVRFAAGETCCGAAALHLGETGLARALARRNLAAFDPDRYDAVVTNAGGCGAALLEYPELLGAEGGERARRFAAKVKDVSELLAGAPRPPAGRIVARAVYVDSCHLRHVQGVADAPRRLLARIPGLELVELERPDLCCGSAGVYNLTQPETAEKVLDAKLRDVAETGARIVVASNPGCQLQLARGVERAGLDAEVVHVAELLDRAYGGTDG